MSVQFLALCRWSASCVTLAMPLLLVISSTSADTVVTIGEKDFNDGEQLNILAYQEAQANEDANLHEVQGIDGTLIPPVTFDEDWTFKISTRLMPIASASITIGIYEHDSAENMPSGDGVLDQVDSFSFDGNDLTAQLNTLFEASGGTVGCFTTEYNVYTVALPSSSFPQLTDGSATFALKLKNGWGPAISGVDNSAGLDFTKLSIFFVGIDGDYNNNGTVEQADLDLVLLNWGDSSTPPGWVNDLPTFPIGQDELDAVRQNWGTVAARAAVTTVPEPTGAMLLLVGVGIACLRRCHMSCRVSTTC